MRHIFLTSVSAALLSTMTMVIAPAASAHQSEPEKHSVTTTDLGGGVYMLEGRGGNVGVSIGEDGVIVVDDQFDYMVPAILDAIGDLTDQPVSFLINTHYHGDHTGGNPAMAEAGATIVAHHNVHKRLNMDFYNPVFDRETKARPEASPHLTYGSDAVFHINGQETHLIHTPGGHTDGDTIVFFKQANVIHMGDNYFNGMFPFIDAGSGGSIDGMIGAHNKALELSDESTQIIPGHGPMASMADLTEARDLLVEIKGRVKPFIDQDVSVDDAIAADPLAGLEDYEAFINKERMIRSVYAGYGKL